MIEKVLTGAEQITPEWLTDLLRERRVLTRGEVVGVTCGDARRTFASTVWHLHVAYSRGANRSAPRRLFLKASNPALAPGEFAPQGQHQEVLFYQVVAPAMDDPPAVACYDAAFEPGTGASHVLLQDVSETHVTCVDPGRQQSCERAVEALARLHASWWDHPCLGNGVGVFPTPQEREEGWADAERRTGEFMMALGDRLRGPWRAAYTSTLRSLPHLYERHATGRNLTLAHGDAHLGNCLFPRDPGSGPTYLVDWQFWHPTIGGTDLAFMIATEWEPQLRRLVEGSLLRRYHAALLERGVQGYPWDSCWNDYRLSVILVSIFIPIWRWSTFHLEADMTALERSMTAFEDLGCPELLI